MRRFIFCRGLYTTQEMDSIESGKIGVYTLTDKGFKLLKNDVVPTEIMNIVVGRKNENGGNIVVPIHKNAFSYTLMSYKAHEAYSAEVVVTAPAVAGDYTIIVAKKGVNFNERNKWTATVHVSDNDIEANMTAAQLAEKLTNAINGNVGSGVNAINGNVGSGVEATLSTATITITAVKAGVDYKVLTADNLITLKPTETPAVIGRGSAEYIKELANKAAADAGFTDTFEEDIDMYKNYPFDPLAGDPTEDHGWDIFTIKFAEPRAMKTVDQVVNQIVQIVVETGTAVNDDLKGVFDAIISGKAVAINKPE